VLAGDFPLVLAYGRCGGVCRQSLPRLGFPLEFDYLHVTRYRGKTSAAKWNGGSAGQNVVGRNVLVLTIFSTRADLAAIRDMLLHMVRHGMVGGADQQGYRAENGPGRFRGAGCARRYVFGLRHGRLRSGRNLPLSTLEDKYMLALSGYG